MSTPAQQIAEPSLQQTWLTGFLTWQLPITVGFAILEIVMLLSNRTPTLTLSSALVGWYVVVLLWARAQVRRGEVVRTSVWISNGLLLLGLLSVLLNPALLPIAVLLPLLAVVVALPCLSRRQLRLQVGVAWLSGMSSIVLAGNVILVPNTAHTLDWLAMIAIAATISATLAMLWVYRERLTQLLEQARAAQRALQTDNAELEALVQTRTAELQARASLTRALTELTSDYVYVVRVTLEQDLQLEWISDAFTRITGYTSAELEPRGFWETLIHPDDRPRARALLYMLLTGEAAADEYRIITKAGAVRWLREYGRPEWDADHRRIVRLLGAAQDITARKHAEEERLTLERNLLETQKLESLGVLAGGIAHEFNNLLMAISGNATLALHDLAPSSTRRSIERITAAAERATHLTRQMLAYTGRGHVSSDVLNLGALVADMGALIAASLPKRVTLRYQLAPAQPPIEADANQVQQVVMNLVLNAAEAIGEADGVVTVASGVRHVQRADFAQMYLAPDLPDGAYVWLEIADTGHGIDAETQRKIFEPFFTTKFSGRGLGLAAVLGIMRGHHGALRVQSAPGTGTSITVLFPASPYPITSSTFLLSTPVSARPPLSLQPPQPLNGQHAARSAEPARGVVLVVDDEPDVRDVTAQMLELLGYRTLTAADGIEGVALFRAHVAEITCVLLDLTMPRMGGVEALRQIVHIRPDARVVLMSGYSEETVASHLADAVLASFLPKPFAIDALRAMMQEVIVLA